MGPETGREKTEVQITPSQADAARLIVGIDAVTGEDTSRVIRKIADAAEEPTAAAQLKIVFRPVEESVPRHSRSRLRLLLRKGYREKR